MLNDLQLNNILEDFDIAYWKISLPEKKISWSPHFNALVGNPDPGEDTFEFFLQEILHEDYRYDFRKHFDGLTLENKPFTIECRLKLESGKFRWFECRNLKRKESGKPDAAVLLFVNIHQAKKDQYTIEENFFYYRETAEMTSTGGWYLDLVNNALYWDDVTKKILECPIDYHPCPEDKLRFYTPGDQEKAEALFKKCTTYGIPFMAELKMRTHHHREFWVRATGKPVYNSSQEIIGIRGIFQDIDTQKINEINLQSALDIIAAQNSKLFNLGHIISHNLRSHSSNLSLVAQLLTETKIQKEKLNLLANVDDISSNLDVAIRQLNTLVTSPTLLTKERKLVKFKKSLELVLTSASSMVKRENAQVIAEFDALDEIFYIPEYLESILLNLISNAVRFKQKGRRPMIYLRTYKENGNAYLEVSDNGMGLDLNQYGDKVFGMHATFHNHPEAKGIGLYIVKNQIEALGGTISIRSDLNIGTTFKIKF